MNGIFSDPERLAGRLRESFAHEPRRTLIPDHYKPSAVLIPIFIKNGELSALFVKRSQSVRHHRGEIAFPGGAFDINDRSLEHTALRETEEEIGVHPSDIRILAELDELKTPTQFHITPFIGVMPYPYPWRINKDEVELVFDVPLSRLVSRSAHRKGFRLMEKNIYEIHYYYHDHHIIWGVTGNILYNFFSRISR